MYRLSIFLVLMKKYSFIKCNFAKIIPVIMCFTKFAHYSYGPFGSLKLQWIFVVNWCHYCPTITMVMHTIVAVFFFQFSHFNQYFTSIFLDVKNPSLGVKNLSLGVKNPSLRKMHSLHLPWHTYWRTVLVSGYFLSLLWPCARRRKGRHVQLPVDLCRSQKYHFYFFSWLYNFF